MQNTKEPVVDTTTVTSPAEAPAKKKKAPVKRKAPSDKGEKPAKKARKPVKKSSKKSTESKPKAPRAARTKAMTAIESHWSSLTGSQRKALAMASESLMKGELTTRTLNKCITGKVNKEGRTKRPPSAFNNFVKAEMTKSIEAEQATTGHKPLVTFVMKALAVRWKNLSPEEQASYKTPAAGAEAEAAVAAVAAVAP